MARNLNFVRNQEMGWIHDFTCLKKYDFENSRKCKHTRATTLGSLQLVFMTTRTAVFDHRLFTASPNGGKAPRYREIERPPFLAGRWRRSRCRVRNRSRSSANRGSSGSSRRA